jgi:hypothetical protein
MTNGHNAAQMRANKTEQVATAVGDGSGVTLATFGGMGYAERVQLHQVNPERYAALSDGREL